LAYALEDWCLSLRYRDIAISRRRCTDRGVGSRTKQEDALWVRDARYTTRSRMRLSRSYIGHENAFSRVRTDEGRVGTPRATPRLGVERVARVRAVVRVARRVGVSPRARAAAHPPAGRSFKTRMRHRGVRTRRVVSSGERRAEKERACVSGGRVRTWAWRSRRVRR
jgi:hypothetical protein